jgi:outer membrane protein, heavy metal efflux system
MTSRFVVTAAVAVAGLGALIYPATAAAQGTPPVTATQTSAAAYLDPQGGLTIEQLLDMAVEHAPRLQASRERIGVAKGNEVQAGLHANPRLDIEGAQQIPGTDNQYSVNFNMPLQLFRIDAQKAAAQRAVTVAEMESHEVEWQLATSVRMAVGRVLSAIRQLDVTEQQVASARAMLRLIQQSVAIGAVPPLERDQADVEMRRLDAAAVRQRADVESALATLRAVLGVDPGTPLRLKQSLDAYVTTTLAGGPPVSLAGDQTTLLAARPDLRRMDAQISFASAERDRLRRDSRFDMDLMAGYMRTNMSFPQYGMTSTGQVIPIEGLFNEVTFGASVMLPWRNKNQGAIAAAEASQREVARLREATSREAQVELQAAVARRDAARQALAIYTGGLLDLARHNLDVLQQTYQLGRASLSDVLSERRRLLDLETTYTAVLTDVYETDLAVRQATGVIR